VLTPSVVIVLVLCLGDSTTALAAKAGRPVPVLMYHVVAEPPDAAPFPHLYVAPDEFAAQLRWLDSRGYRVVTLGAVLDAWAGKAALPARAVVLTFDDGYVSQFTNAFPHLWRLGWPATLNLDVSNVDEPWGLHPWMVSRLIAAGWEIGAHSLTHPDLRLLGASDLRREVSGSRLEIKRRFGITPRFFCYPSGRYDDRVLAAVAAAGYEAATSVESGLASPYRPFELRRVRIDRGDGARMLAVKLAELGQPTNMIAVHGALGSR
jgi:peptidoglycan/xylan/chitin deacetylase (PgdA/CDA1 family)